MALNPVAYTENVVRSFLRYQLTAYPFATRVCTRRCATSFRWMKHVSHRS